MDERRYIETSDKKALWLVITIAIVFILIRNNGLYPIVFADEFTYSKFSRLVQLSDSALPNYLYFMVYRITNVCGDGFLGCARILNTAFFFLTVPLLFYISRKLTGSRLSSVFCTIVAFGQANTYTTYFMPECMYMIAFWACTLMMLSSDRCTRISRWAVIGSLWGLSALVKPHTLFLLPAIFVYTLYVSEGLVKGKTREALTKSVAVSICLVAAKLILGYLIAGKAGLTFFGTFYAPYAGATLYRDAHYYIELATNTLNSAFGHILALALLYAVPVALTAEFWVAAFQQRRVDSGDYGRLVVYLTLVVGCLICVTSIFTASISNVEPANHLHVRYYLFALPLLILLPVINCSEGKSYIGRIGRIAIATPIAALLIYGASRRLHPYEVHSSTAPELFSVLGAGWLFYAIAIISLVSLVAWAVCSRAGSICYVFLLTPILIAVVGFNMNESLRRSVVPDIYDRAATFTNAYLDKKERQTVMIIGSASGVGGLFRTLYHLDLPVTEYGIQTAEGEYDLKDLPDGKNWVLVIGDHPLEGHRVLTIPGNGFSLIRAR